MSVIDFSNASSRSRSDNITHDDTSKLLKLLYSDPAVTQDGCGFGPLFKESAAVLYQSEVVIYKLLTLRTPEDILNQVHYLVLNALYTGIEIGRSYKTDSQWKDLDTKNLCKEDLDVIKDKMFTPWIENSNEFVLPVSELKVRILPGDKVNIESLSK